MSEAKKEVLKKIELYSACFNGPNGKRVLEDMQKSYGGSCFDPDPGVMAFREGRRQVVLDIQDLIKGKQGTRTKRLIEALSKTEEETE